MCLIASRIPENFKSRPREERIFNFASGLVNPVTWKQIRDFARYTTLVLRKVKNSLKMGMDFFAERK